MGGAAGGYGGGSAGGYGGVAGKGGGKFGGGAYRAGGGGGACGCDDACGVGDCGVGCGPGYDTTGVLSYVGAGGDYKQETTFTYVGQGAGDFEMVPAATNLRQNICMCIIPPILLLLFVPFLLYLLAQLSSEPITTTLPPIPSAYSATPDAFPAAHAPAAGASAAAPTPTP